VAFTQPPPRQPEGAITGDPRQPLVEPEPKVVKKPKEISAKIVEGRALGLSRVPGAQRIDRRTTDTSTLRGISRVSFPKFGEVKPDQDYGPLASARREMASRESFEDYRRIVSKAGRARPAGDALTAPETPGLVTGDISLPVASKQFYADQASQLLQTEFERRTPRDITNNPVTQELVKLLRESGAEVKEKDIDNLADWGILNSAANKVIALEQAGDTFGMLNVYSSLEETSPYMAGLLPAIVEEKLMEAIQDPTIVEKIMAGLLSVFTPVIEPFVLANEWVMTGARAATVADNALEFISQDARKAVQEGNYDLEYIEKLRESGNYSDMQISIALEVQRRMAMGHPDPVFSLYIENYLGDEQAADIVQEIMFGESDSVMQELLRQIDSASLGNTGQVILGSFAPTDDYRAIRGTKGYQNLANVTGFGYSIVADPTLFAYGVGRAAQAARWALLRLAPGSSESASSVIRKMKFGRFEVNTRTSRFFDQFTNDLNKLDELKAASKIGTTQEKAAKFATYSAFRTRLTRQYERYLPDDVIDDFIRYAKDPDTGKYSIQSAGKYIDADNTAYIVSRGQISDDLAALGATADEIPALVQQALNKADIKPIYAKIAGQNQKRIALTPGMSLVGALRKNAVNGIIAGLMPEDRAIKVLTKYIDSFDDTGEFSQQLSSKALEVGRETRKTKFFTGEGWFDSIGRLFSSIAIQRSVAVNTGADAKTIYRWSRQFFPHRTSQMFSQMWRDSTGEGARRLLLSGLARSAAASRGIYMSQKQADTWVHQLTPGAKRLGTGTRPGEQYGVSVPAQMLPSQRVAQASEIAALKASTRREMKESGASKAEIDRAVASIDEQYTLADDTVYRSLSADSDGIESALHLYQTSRNVALPTLREFEQLRGDLKFGVIPWGVAREGVSKGLQATTDYWSVWTLFGFRFSLRNAVEEVGLYWLMGGPRAVYNFFKGRQVDQAARSVKPRVFVKIVKKEDGSRVAKLDKDGVPIVVFKSDLGMFANKVEWLRRRATLSWRDKAPGTKFHSEVREALEEWQKHKGFRHWMAEMILPATRYDDSLIALQEFAKGNPEAFAALAQKALMARKSRSPLTAALVGKDDEIAFNYAVNSVHGMALLDEVAEAAPYLNSGNFPAFIRASGGISDELAGIPGISFGKIGSQGAMRGRLGDYTNVPPLQRNVATNEDIWGVSFWWRELQHTLDGDGTIGTLAINGIRGMLTGRMTPEQAKASIAQAIRDDKTFGYRERLSQLATDAGIDDYASRYFENALQHFTRADGSINKRLVNQFFDKDGNYLGWWAKVGDEGITPRISMADLKSFDSANRPAFIFGQAIDQAPYVPYAETLPALFSQNRNWIWMGAQNTRISRAPLFWANYSDQFAQTLSGRSGLARAIAGARGRKEPTAIDRKIADDEFARWSLDNAFNLTLSYIDNPANRSNLAWRARNVSRYYRAQEDFYRRLVRVAKNSPETYWRTALIYQNLDDTGFVYTDDNGDKYFAYPGNELLQDVMSYVPSLLMGVEPKSFKDIDPFFIGGKVTGIAPSTDLKQQAPSFSSPTMAFSAASIFHAFPGLAGLRSVFLGSYSQQTGSFWTDITSATLPAGFIRALRVADPEQVESSILQSALDAMAIMTATGQLNKLTVTTDDGSYEIDAVNVTPEQFMQTDQWSLLQVLAIGNFYTKQMLSWVAAAAPQNYRNDVSDFARMSGIVDAKAAQRRFRDIFFDEKYLELVEKHADGPNPFAVGLSEWYALKMEEATKEGFASVDSLMPFTNSKYKNNPERIFADFESLRVTDEWAKWENSEKSKRLTRNGFGDVRRFLAPFDGEFEWGAWNVATAVTGAKVPKTAYERIEENFAVTGQALDNQIRRTYERLISDTSDPDEQKALREAMSKEREENRLSNPAWNRVSSRFNSGERQILAREALVRVDSMLKFIEKTYGSLDADESAMRDAIDVFLYYESQKSGLQGTRSQVSEARLSLDNQMQNDLLEIKSQNEKVANFVEGVIDTATYNDQYFTRREMR
jgi:hypothetical protein